MKEMKVVLLLEVDDEVSPEDISEDDLIDGVENSTNCVVTKIEVTDG